jgi:transaldolase
MATLLEQLRSMTTVVADSGDINSIVKFKPTDSTTNPSLIAAAAEMPAYAPIVDEVLMEAREQAGSLASDQDVATLAFKTLAVAFGKKILEIVPGRVSTEVDARLSYDTEKTLEQARDIIKQYDQAGIGRDRVLIKIASTWEGIKAAEVLEKEGIHCNLTLLFGLHQAIACAEAKVTLISPFVGRILDWYKKDTGKDYTGADDPGVQSVTTIYNYYKKFGYKTQVMGASFRNIGEITELAGCDLLTIAPKLLAELHDTTGELDRKLDPAASAKKDVARLSLDEATFRAMHAADPMASDKLEEGIAGFSKALVALEKLLGERLRVLRGLARAGAAAQEYFKIYDLDGDGFITREEWGGSDAVFHALDVNGDGRVSPEELAAGLGAAFHLKASA